MTKIIVGNVDWMRNDYICDVSFGGIVYPSVEHAYQAAKFLDKNKKLDIKNADLKEALRIGRKSNGVRKDWIDVREDIMAQLLRAKFMQNDLLGERLAKTGDEDIVMRGYNSFWGTGRDGSGENILGQLLNNVRFEIQIVLGIDPDLIDYSKDDTAAVPPTLKDALLYEMDEYLATTCQELYDDVSDLLTLVDGFNKDYEAAILDYIARKTGVSSDDVVSKFKKVQKSLYHLKDIVNDHLKVVVLNPNDDEDDNDYEYHDDY